MKYTLLIASFWGLIYFDAIAHEDCDCEQLRERSGSQLAALDTARLEERAFSNSFDTGSVRGVINASYCHFGDEHGLLFVHLHNKNIIYKGVPMKVWFEFRFSESVENYYRAHIKYSFITAQIEQLSPNLGDVLSEQIVQ